MTWHSTLHSAISETTEPESTNRVQTRNKAIKIHLSGSHRNLNNFSHAVTLVSSEMFYKFQTFLVNLLMKRSTTSLASIFNITTNISLLYTVHS